MYELKSSATGEYWHIELDGQVLYGAPKRGHGSATKAQMLDWIEELESTAPCMVEDPSY